MGKAIDNIYTDLGELGLYLLNGDGYVDCELMAYEAAFSVVEGLLANIEKQAFVQTAWGDGLLAHERLVGLGVRAGLSDESRRELIGYRRSIAASDFTVQGMIRSMLAAGIDAELIENYPLESITIRSNMLIDMFDGMDEVQLRLSEMLPAHLDWEFDTGYLTWDMFDGKNPSWDNWDTRDFIWDKFDIDGHNIF